MLWCSPQPTQHTPQFQKWPWNSPISHAGPQPGTHLDNTKFDPPRTLPSLYILCMCVTAWNSQSLFTYLHAQTPLCCRWMRGCHFEILSSSRDQIQRPQNTKYKIQSGIPNTKRNPKYKIQSGKSCLWPSWRQKDLGGLWVLWRHTEAPGLNTNPVCLGPCQGTLWAQPLWTDLLGKEAVAIKSSWATPRTQLPPSV